MAFKFNFLEDPLEENQKENQTIDQEKNDQLQAFQINIGHVDLSAKSSSTHSIETLQVHNSSYKKTQAFKKYALVNAESVLQSPRGKELSHLLQKSDLISGVYEGGFKVWECAIDLVEYLMEVEMSKGQKVMEMGCGHGLPGIYTLQQGANVDFQDYNAEVIEQITIPNVALNLEWTIDQISTHAKFYVGDWEAVNKLLTNSNHGHYDIMLNSDSLYNTQSHSKLYGLIKDHLHPEGLIATKSYYFGVGGSAAQFVEFVNNDNAMDVEVVRKFNDGFSNVREILKLTFKHSHVK